jgi:hypothetical protein
MLYMVIERFKENAAPEIYRRLREKGRMMPEGTRIHFQLDRFGFQNLLAARANRKFCVV